MEEDDAAMYGEALARRRHWPLWLVIVRSQPAQAPDLQTGRLLALQSISATFGFNEYIKVLLKDRILLDLCTYSCRWLALTVVAGSSCSRAVGSNRISEQEEGRGKLTHGGGDWGSIHGGVPDVGVLSRPACPAGACSCHGILSSGLALIVVLPTLEAPRRVQDTPIEC